MKFAKLRLQGFKSFVEPAELEIRDGLTGIVGPNGCGKSNLLEALRWVMGEGSARSLRAGSGGDGMDEVIFAGTAKRPRRDMAEVRLLLDNRARRAPAEWNDNDQLEVARSIRRGEGSGYAVNGRDVRLKDVQLLFADAATGAHSPALVGQGRVAAIIAARPQERRQLLEEAAGIAGLNVRRREAEQRLRAADLNLARLDDLLAAREAQAGQLRRQAKVAARYRQLSDSIRARQAALLRLEWVAAVEGGRQAGRALASLEAALEEYVASAARASAAQADAAAGLPGRREAESATAAVLQRLGAARATLVAEQAAAVRRLRDLQAALEAATADAGREQARARDREQTKARLAEELELQQQAEAEAGRLLPAAAEAARAAETAATLTERQLAQAVEAHAALVAESRSVRAQAEAAGGRAGRLLAERQRLEGELARLRADKATASLDADIREGAETLQLAAAQLETALAAISTAEQQAEAARQAAAAVERAALAARAEVTSLEAEARALQRLQPGKGAPASSAVRRSLGVAPGFEAAVAAALGADIGADIGPAAGRHWLHIGRQADDPPLPDGVRPLLGQVQGAPELARRLAQLGVVEQPPTVAALAALKPGQALVSVEGWLWRWDGLVQPPGGGSAAVAESLAQDNRLAEIATRLEQPRRRQAAAEAELDSQQQQLTAAQHAERQARAHRLGAEQRQQQLSARLQGLQSARAQVEARLAAIEASVERLAAEGENATAEAERAAGAVTGLADASALGEQLSVARRTAERARATLAEARAEAAATERNRQEAAARIARLRQELAEWQRRDRDADAAGTLLQQRIGELAAERARLVAEPDALAVRLRLLDDEIKAAEQQRQQAAEAILAAELSLAELDRQARAADALVADSREQRATAIAAVEVRQEKLSELVRQSLDRFGCQPRDLPGADNVAASAAELAGALAAMERERERIGVVNLRADLELAEIEERLGRDRAERSELETAIHRLRGSIGTLNREGRARLLAAFAEVDGHFRDLFTTLFGGGMAELLLVESDDPLAAGLEIRAQPPGKKLQSLTLLSGGEQALTAIALVFALFRTAPAPVSVLDEVDAPLDDANVERFTRLLAHMAASTATRFLVVTHNPVTMAAMHRLYGVTMGEPGVSQLVSVALREAEALVAEPGQGFPA